MTLLNIALRPLNFLLTTTLWLLFALLCGGYVNGQQPQTATTSPQALQGINSKWVQGVGPGYYPTCSPASCSSTLTLAVGAGTCFDTSGTRHTYAGGTLTMTGSATNYVYLLASNCALTQNTSGYPATGIMPIATITATSTITVRVDDRTFFGGSGAAGASTNFVVREVPSGTINGSNTAFTLAHTPISGSEVCALNGLEQTSGGGNDYTISSANITYSFGPATGDTLWCSYRY